MYTFVNVIPKNKHHSDAKNIQFPQKTHTVEVLEVRSKTPAKYILVNDAFTWAKL